jgi:hypothetical protein
MAVHRRSGTVTNTAFLAAPAQHARRREERRAALRPRHKANCVVTASTIAIIQGGLMSGAAIATEACKVIENQTIFGRAPSSGVLCFLGTVPP